MSMPANLNQYFIELLEVLGYEGDKARYAQQCIAAGNAQMVSELVKQLDPQTAAVLKQQLAHAETAAEMEAVIRQTGQYFQLSDLEQYAAQVLQVQTQFIIDSVYPTLDGEQKAKLDAYVTNMSAPSVN